MRLVDNKVHGFRGGNCITTANDNYDLHDIDVIGNLAFAWAAALWTTASTSATPAA